MYSTMHSFPLTITAILRHACHVHGARKVTTATGDGYRDCTYAELGQHAAQLANALRRIGVTGDQRVATFMWNNAEHLAAYLAVTQPPAPTTRTTPQRRTRCSRTPAGASAGSCCRQAPTS